MFLLMQNWEDMLGGFLLEESQLDCEAQRIITIKQRVIDKTMGGALL